MTSRPPSLKVRTVQFQMVYGNYLRLFVGKNASYYKYIETEQDFLRYHCLSRWQRLAPLRSLDWMKLNSKLRTSSSTGLPSGFLLQHHRALPSHHNVSPIDRCDDGSATYSSMACSHRYATTDLFSLASGKPLPFATQSLGDAASFRRSTVSSEAHCL